MNGLGSAYTCGLSPVNHFPKDSSVELGEAYILRDPAHQGPTT